MEKPALVPELDVADLTASLRAYQHTLGFELLFGRQEEAFAYLVLGHAHLMLQQADGPGRRFRTAQLKRPYGRGLNLQINIADAHDLYARVCESDLDIVIELEERWYRQDATERGNRQFVVADLDGYLLRFCEDLGKR